MKTVLLAALVALSLVAADGYHILCVFGIPSRSHDHHGGGIVKALLKGGHEVTWVTPYPSLKEPAKGLHIIDASVTLPIADNLDMSNPETASKMGFSFIRDLSSNLSTAVIGIPELREAVVKTKFDAVVTETFFSDLDAGFAAVLQAPWILLSGITLQPITEALVDEVRSLPILPLLFNDFPIPMNLRQRATNVAIHALMTLDAWWNYQQSVDVYEALFRPLATARGMPLPPLNEAAKNISILFVNSHNSFAPAQSLPPNVVEIGGYHIEDSIKPLPKDMQDLLDSSTQGVVYFSMGSVLKSAYLPVSTRNVLFKVLGELPYTVLWKFETELKDLPMNVHVRSWMPQAAILAHKNTRAFITHGGLLSTLESLQYGVPLITIPVFGDQPINAARAVRSGYALKVDYNFDTMAQQLKEALNEMLGNDKYYKQAKYLSSLFNNRPVSPAKLISHYVELAIETQGAYHLRSKALLYTWYQRWMLDLAAILLTILLISYYVIKKTLCFIYCKVTGSSCKKDSKKDKKVKRQ